MKGYRFYLEFADTYKRRKNKHCGMQNEGFCAECADKREHKVTDVAGHFEGQPFTCDDCGAEIESAYGDPESDDESEEG